jgi:phosphoribosyl 1,2-cyclic phosphodiesterase
MHCALCNCAVTHDHMLTHNRVTGVLAIRLHVSGTDGSVRGVSALTDTLVVDPNTSQFDEDGEEYDVSTHLKCICICIYIYTL